ncbi:hypothetical protein [Paenibacillus herberti]|uniref:Uncharacterized protein n=1 Tax=Paenibacillus herberti TaxID=1619309 RepID=A0A229NU05_9BACL|nr:hypothetical protein [Paenibacillus herberti]OXM13175.1 hypothetical protein CGZ75_23735 [Paenibacillus herberti]
MLENAIFATTAPAVVKIGLDVSYGAKLKVYFFDQKEDDWGLFYENLSLPIYLIVSIGSGLLLIAYFICRRSKYSVLFVIGMIFISLTSILSGIMRLINEYTLFNRQLEYVQKLPFIGFIGIPLLIIGAYQQSSRDPEKRKLIIRLGVLFISIMIFLGVIVLIALMKRK